MKRKRDHPCPCPRSYPRPCPVETANGLSTAEFVERYLSGERVGRVVAEIEGGSWIGFGEGIERRDGSDAEFAMGRNREEGGSSRENGASCEGSGNISSNTSNGSGSGSSGEIAANEEGRSEDKDEEKAVLGMKPDVDESRETAHRDEEQNKNENRNRNGKGNRNGGSNENKRNGVVKSLPESCVEVQHYSAHDLPTYDLETCLTLVEQTSRADYDSSHDRRWSTTAKRREMLTPGMRYILLRLRQPYSHISIRCDSTSNLSDSDSISNTPSNPSNQKPKHYNQNKTTSSIAGFISYLPTHEPTLPVLYIYEIHLHPALRHRHLGKNLLSLVQHVAAALPVDKIMLSVFKRNRSAWEWYLRRGFAIDAFSPETGEKRLRGGRRREREASYGILSWEVDGSTSGSSSGGDAGKRQRCTTQYSMRQGKRKTIDKQ